MNKRRFRAGVGPADTMKPAAGMRVAPIVGEPTWFVQVGPSKVSNVANKHIVYIFFTAARPSRVCDARAHTHI